MAPGTHLLPGTVSVASLETERRQDNADLGVKSESVTEKGALSCMFLTIGDEGVLLLQRATERAKGRKASPRASASLPVLENLAAFTSVATARVGRIATIGAHRFVCRTRKKDLARMVKSVFTNTLCWLGKALGDQMLLRLRRLRMVLQGNRLVAVVETRRPAREPMMIPNLETRLFV
jgi:hypothetical protein